MKRVSKKKMPKKILVALSGGVDSAVSAYLLKQRGYDVHAVFMKNVTAAAIPGAVCPWKEDRVAAYEVAANLGIPIETWDFVKEYRKKVVRYLVSEYRAGRTPNPDVLCNSEIKFRVFLDRARKEGYEIIATGHYARIQKTKDGVVHLLKGKDANKDQSYFLSRLTQRQLQPVLFPVGNMKKPEVRAIAKKIRLPNALRSESQGICFIGEVDLRKFLSKYMPDRPGDIVSTDGRNIGRHEGLFSYTIGQRRGLNIGGGPPLYVVGKDMKRNRLIAGTDTDAALYARECHVADWQWISRGSLPLHCRVKLRYRQADQEAVISRRGSKVIIRFTKVQRAIAPGQFAVAYVGQELVGSGVITS